MSTKNNHQFTVNNILLRILEHMSHIKISAKYSSNNYTYSYIIINNLIFNRSCNALSKYKDFQLLNKRKEFICRFYCKKEIKIRLKKIGFFYENYSKVFPNYMNLYEGKYIYKNIRKKQKIMDAVNKLKNEKNMEKEYEINNNCFDNEIFKGPLFTDEVECEIAKDNIINNSNCNNNEDKLFTQNSISLYLNNENNNQDNNKLKNEIGMKNNLLVESFIANNESNGSIYNIMDILNENKIYVNDLRFLLDNKENINIDNKKNNNKYIKIENNNKDKNRKYETIKEILIKGGIYLKKISQNNIHKKESNNELVNSNNIKEEFNSSIGLNNKNNKKINIQKHFSPYSTIIEKNKRAKKAIKMENININALCESISKDKDKDKKMSTKKIILQEINNNKNIKRKSLDKFFLNNTNDNNHLQTIPAIETVNNNTNSLTKVNQNSQQSHLKFQKTIKKEKNRNNCQEKNSLSLNKRMNMKQFSAIKKYIRYKHISQDLCRNYNQSKEKKNNSIGNNKYFSGYLSNNLEKNYSKMKKESIISKSSFKKNSISKSNKDLSQIKKIKRPQIINNQIIIQNNNNYFFTENNNPNLITRTNNNNYDADDCDTEREKLLEYLKGITEFQKMNVKHRKVNCQEKNKDIFNIVSLINENTEDNNRLSTNKNKIIKKIKDGKFLRDLITKHRTERKFKKNYKYYINHINSNISCNYPIIKYNTKKKMSNYKRNNSNITEKLINSINFSKIKKYSSNFSLKQENLISPNRDIMTNNIIKAINCYSNTENKSSNEINNALNKKEKMQKAKTTKIVKENKKFLQVSDISNDSTRNILSQRLKKNHAKEFAISKRRDEAKKVNHGKSKKKEIMIIDNNKNLTISSFNTENKRLKSVKRNKINKIESYNNKRQNTEFKFRTNLTKNKFSCCDFYSINQVNSNFSKGLLDRINSIKIKIDEGFYRNNQSTIAKKEKVQKTSNNKIYNNSTFYGKGKINEYKEKKTNNKNLRTQKIYENKMIYNDNKENIPPQLLIKVNKTKYYGNTKSHFYMHTDINI